MNFIPVQIQGSLITNHNFQFALPEHWQPAIQNHSSNSLLLGLRPEHLTLGASAPQNFYGRIQMIEALGTDTFVIVQLQGLTEPDLSVQVRLPADQKLSIGQEIWLSLNPDKIHLFDPQSTLALVPN
jgi:multiple sugar transport system ATP-binding protein